MLNSTSKTYFQFCQDMKTSLYDMIRVRPATPARLLRARPAAILLFMAAAFLSSCSGNRQQAGAMKAPRVSVTAYTVNPSTYTVTDNFAATLQANTIVELRPDVTGYLQAILAKDGSLVKKGQPLYEIDKSRYEAAYNQAQAALEQAKADLAQKQRDLARYQDLLKHDAIAKQTVDQASTAVKTSEANLAAAKAALAKAGTDLSHSVLKAPVSGKLGIAQVKIGDIINAGQTLVNTIVNDDPIYADFNVPQAETGVFSKSNSSVSYHLQLADSSVYPEPGKLLVINNMVDPTTGTLQIRLEFPNHHGELRSGMNAIVQVSHPSSAGAVAIPTKSLIQTLAETSVYVISDADVIRDQQVQAGATIDNGLTLVKGLQAGQRIVVNGLQQAHPGDTVNVIADSTRGNP